ncbi:nuclear pore complex protein NUP214 [Quercus suber]|uniref:nuclear pore complex protein NUP214 n=1 Tax=Quercus suber TaxID=58331 RepID=UPI000CE20E87|nr:nuclear pore complex protein NUP214-like [Quercus suber]
MMPFLRDYDRLQSFAVILIYIQIGCALIGSLGALYNGVLLINLGIALFALVAIESRNQKLSRTYAVLLFCALPLDVSWFILFTHEIWNISSEDYGIFIIFSLKLTLAMQIIGFTVRLLSSLLWIQIYKLGISYVDTTGSREADYDLRNSFLSPATPTVVRQTSDSDYILGGSIFDPAYFSSLFEGQENRCSHASKSEPGENVLVSSTSLVLSTPSSPMIKSMTAPQSSSATPTFLSSMPLSRPFTSSNASADANLTMPTSSSSASPSLITSSSGSFSLQASKTSVPLSTPISESPKTELQPPMAKSSLKTDKDASKQVSSLQCEPPKGEIESKLEPSVTTDPTIEISTSLTSGSQPSFSNMANPTPNVTLNAQPAQPSTARVLFPTSLPTSRSTTGEKNGNLDVAETKEDEMEEEAPETSNTAELSLGSLGAFGIGSTPTATAPKSNPFGGFDTRTTAQAPTQTGFCQPQPAQIGSGQQALLSVLGSFGQSRQIGTGLPGTGFGSPSGFGGGGFTGTSSPGGFSSAATGGGFASISSTGGGFSGVASGVVGFASVASAGGSRGFSGVGFAGAPSAGGGFAGASSACGGFGAFNSQQGSGFSAFNGWRTGKPSELFTQIRK